MKMHRVGIIGLGKITQDQHVPVIGASPSFELVAVASQRGLTVPGVPHAFTDYAELLRLADVDAVAVCTPPQVRHAIALDALEAGKHVLLEKPPTATVSELAHLERIADGRGLTLFATWHSQFNPAVDEAREFLASRTVRTMFVNWKEDVRRWHPGQKWIWRAGGFGVFDPGINALSIVTKILPEPIFVQRADLSFPANADAPIAAEIAFTGRGKDQSLRAEFDWRQTGPQTWEIEIETADGKRLQLSNGGSRLVVDGKLVVESKPEEYQRIYERFDELLRTGASDVDAQPFQLVGDAFMLGRRITVEPFHD
ncbi:MAG: Gfo/Idh/MocA family oxidoreductase [Methylobacteriaceae bacterium]|nr:Gfo/Idh/MocA family oxidoreductase [Methylobacteriaceae bacterium]